MNREILYHAKRTNTDEWIEGYYVRITLTGSAYILPGELAVEPCKKGIVQFKCCEVQPETVCQYTGLTDKNGRKIFEGDIVRAAYKPKDEDLTVDDFIIKWDKYYCKYVGHYARKENVYNPLLFGSQTSFEVIGSIFDNPELLRGA